MHEALTPLREILAGMDRVAVAVSGGVDSLTLASLAHDVLGERAAMHHATSPAVPPSATQRTRELAAARGWRLEVFDAGEFADPRYRSNPVNRCFFCKINLYGAIAGRTTAQVLSGTNLDDLGEYRPGLDAALEYGVRHPFVEAGVTKAMVRRLAAGMGLGSVAELPAAPCLASRVETGIAIQAPVLAMIDAAERRLRAVLDPRTVRCRVRAGGVVVELDGDTLARLDPVRADALRTELAGLVAGAGLDAAVSFAPYRTGSAFLRPAS
ncbi:MAG: hypothetical protein P4L71_18660 [Acetobacteraceae bacterium]|nr:hypothetical protein [Acetobacteraceae bacterium]